MEEEDNYLELIDDVRFYKKDKILFTKCWGIVPDTRQSINALTESNTNDPKKFLDPLANGISLDLIEDNVGGIDSRMHFSENALFKLNSLQVPSVLSKEVVVDSSYTELSIEDNNLLKSMHVKHEENDYTIQVYVDKVLELLTIPNSNYSSLMGALRFKHRYFETPQYNNRNFANRLDQRVTLQLYPGLLEQGAAYDLKSFNYRALQKDHTNNIAGIKTS